MIRYTTLLCAILMLGLACAHPEKRSARYDSTACPICAELTHGNCSYCYGTSHCMFCKGEKERTTVSPNMFEDQKVKPFSYKEPCPFCKNSGLCTYCSGTGKCWACTGTAKVTTWSCLNEKIARK